MPKTIKKICFICKKTFVVHPYKKDTAKYCSHSCASKSTLNAYKTGKVKKTCLYCDKEYYVFPCSEKRSKFCSRSCRAKHNRPHFKTGKYISLLGYVLVLVNSKYIFEHRIIMEKHLKRPLLKTEVIHHINGIRTDNRIENLIVMQKRKHDSMESKKRWRENPSSFVGKSKERCNAIITERHKQGQKCKQYKPCRFHNI